MANQEDRAAFRKDIRRAAYDLPSPPAVTGTVPDPEDVTTWAFDGPEDYSGEMPALPPVDPETRKSAATGEAADG